MKPQKAFIFCFLIFLGVMIRYAFSEWIQYFGSFDAFLFIGLLSFSVGYIRETKAFFLIPVFVMVISDLIFYNEYYLILVSLFVYTGFFFMSIIGWATKKTLTHYGVFGVISVFLYDVWTNLGFWLTPFYQHNIAGLKDCYVMALPFMLWHILSFIVFIPLAFSCVYVYKNLLKTEVLNIAGFARCSRQ